MRSRWQVLTRRGKTDVEGQGRVAIQHLCIRNRLNPRILEGNLGMAWGVGGWLMSWFYGEDRLPNGAATTRSRDQRTHHYVRQSSHVRNIVARGAFARKYRCIQPPRNRREIPYATQRLIGREETTEDETPRLREYEQHRMSTERLIYERRVV
jgi:hypothetical protein